MDFTAIFNEHLDVLVVLACLIVGYIIKTSFNKIPNKYIPTIVTLVGALVNVCINGLSITTIIYGAFMGLASTGLYEWFRQFVENKK
jgi:prepilin signal peptidase PulO-like enzyme (type II secretory pathway)